MKHPYAYGMEVRKHIPQWLWRLIATVGNTIVGSWDLLWNSGYLRSCLQGKPVDRKGRPLPWLAEGAVDFLGSLDLHRKIVVEYGGGQSSLWFRNQDAHVTVVEPDEKWAAYLRSKGLKVFTEWTLEKLNHIYFEEACSIEVFLLDLNPRVDAINWILKLKVLPRYLVVDNTNNYDPVDDEAYKRLSSYYPIRIDFSGHAVGAIAKQVTSVYTTPEAFSASRPMPYKVHNSIWTPK